MSATTSSLSSKIARFELRIGNKIALVVDLLEAIQPDFLILLQEVVTVGVLEPLDLFRGKLFDKLAALGGNHAPVCLEPRIDLSGGDPDPDNGLPVILRP
jgi:hypothetical protein